MNKFEVGQEVRCIEATPCSHLRVGEIYTVWKVSSSGGITPASGIESNFTHPASSFELVHRFTKGQQVRCVDSGSKCHVKKGEIYTVRGCTEYHVTLEGKQFKGSSYQHKRFEAAYANPPHIHAALIVEWALGAEIEFTTSSHPTTWKPIYDTPMWLSNNAYRVKPTNIKSLAEIERDEIKAEMDKLSVAQKDLAARLEGLNVKGDQ